MEDIINQLNNQGRLQEGNRISLESSKMSRSSQTRESRGHSVSKGQQKQHWTISWFFVVVVLFTLGTRYLMRKN